MNWIIAPLKKYAVFEGRARRKEYWIFALVITIFYITLRVYADISRGSDSEILGSVLLLLFILATVVPMWAVTVRRLHDVGKSGWWIFINFIPLIGNIWLFVLTVTDGQPGVNQYGPNPKENAIAA